MACDLKQLNSYGDGSLGAISNPTGQVNSYANVTAYTNNTVTIGTPSAGAYETFAVGKEIMLHVSATNGTSTDVTYLGKYLVCKITAVSGSVLTVDKDFTAVMPTTSFSNYQVQAITICQFESLTLSSGSITPPAYSVSNKYGGILLAKCSDMVTFSGGSINLVDKGIPVASTAYRMKTAQETNGTADTDKYSGWENHITLRQFLLNAGDGAAMVIAKHYFQSGTASRVGGTTAGVQFTRGNVGGSTIALICGDMSGFDVSIISKIKGSGQGLGRCYIASSTKLRNDEGLYAYDIISDPLRLMRTLNIKNYGDVSLGDVMNPTVAMNNYAKVTAISLDGKTIVYTNKTSTGLAPIAAGALVMFHVSKHTDSADISLLGRFILAKVISDDGNNLILDTAITNVFAISKLSKYSCQIISVAQFNTLTVSTNYSATTAWNDTNKIGGICAIACKSAMNLTGGQVNVECKGGGAAYSTNGLAFISNNGCSDILLLGQGHGSVFILAQTITLDSASRIGATSDGSAFGGYDGTNKGGYRGKDGSGGTSLNCQWTAGGGGSGSAGGVNASGYNSEPFGKCNMGGYGSNAVSRGGGGQQLTPGVQGAHIFIICNTINNFMLSAISTGGGCGYNLLSNAALGKGGAGYGGYGGTPNASYSSATSGGGGYNGGGGAAECALEANSSYSGGGGSTGWAFIYANTIMSEDTTGVII